MGNQNIVGGTRVVPVKFELSATAFSRDGLLNVEPLKSDSFISADVKLARLHYHLD